MREDTQKIFAVAVTQDVTLLLLSRCFDGDTTEGNSVLLKEVAFIAGKSENQAAKNIFIHFFNDNLIANISLYALSWPKLNFGCHLAIEIIF